MSLNQPSSDHPHVWSAFYKNQEGSKAGDDEANMSQESIHEQYQDKKFALKRQSSIFSKSLK